MTDPATTRRVDPRDRILYSPICDRPRIEWPGGARVALWVSPNVEHYEYTPPVNPTFNLFTRVATPDAQQYAFRDYGNRVGFWRMNEVFREFGIRPTVSLNFAVLAHYPEIRDTMLADDWAFMSHGMYNTRPVFGYDEDQEREFFVETIAMLKKHTARDLKGMLGPVLSSTTNTPDLMAEFGLIYHTDWTHDDQPVPIPVRNGGKLVSIPYDFELNDANPKPMTVEALARHWKGQFDRLWREGAESGRVMSIPVHPYLIGQPQAVGYFREVFEHIRGHDGVWYTTADEIAEHFIAHSYDAHLAHALELAAKAGGR